MLDNTSKDMDSAWECLYIAYNSREEDLVMTLPEGRWEILADADSSFRWKNPRILQDEAAVKPHSVLILGKRSE